MQLKRDTDYALRILCRIREAQAEDGAEPSRGLTLSEIASQAGVPRLAAGRICARLGGRGIIRAQAGPENGEQTYFSAAPLGERTLLDVVEAVENTGRIFAVFDKRSLMYRRCEGRIQEVQARVERALADTTLDDFFGVGERERE